MFQRGSVLTRRLLPHPATHPCRVHLVIPSLLRQGRFLFVCAPGPLHKETKCLGSQNHDVVSNQGGGSQRLQLCVSPPPLVDRSVDVSNYVFIIVRAPLHVHRTAMWFPTRV